MPWDTSPEKRRKDAATYGSAEYRTSRKQAIARANGCCEKCQSRDRVQVDHIVPVSQGGGHSLSNLRVLCLSCHQRVTAQQGGGYRKPGPRGAGHPDPPATPTTQW